MSRSPDELMTADEIFDYWCRVWFNQDPKLERSFADNPEWAVSFRVKATALGLCLAPRDDVRACIDLHNRLGDVAEGVKKRREERNVAV